MCLNKNLSVITKYVIKKVTESIASHPNRIRFKQESSDFG